MTSLRSSLTQIYSILTSDSRFVKYIVSICNWSDPTLSGLVFVVAELVLLLLSSGRPLVPLLCNALLTTMLMAYAGVYVYAAVCRLRKQEYANVWRARLDNTAWPALSESDLVYELRVWRDASRVAIDCLLAALFVEDEVLAASVMCVLAVVSALTAWIGTARLLALLLPFAFGAHTLVVAAVGSRMKTKSA
eukprot:TRINITY_DN3365_c0_g1_i1.p1 TRINITY_DN3365_c0_g1~~TRINITY_DN3365_c0_g1_i1.p1  ORF type:complete len:206 (+),score=40.36 TRINITY_DN3365_c0_g1_i1:45-620(+)